MRIISGKFKNKKIFFPNNLKTRPLKDSVRENIFNILDHSNNLNIIIKNSNVLDFYSGSGSFGLECISREASKVFFIENDFEALKNLKKNITNLNSENKTVLFDKNVSDFIKNLDTKIFNKKFDIVFFDPPYKNQNYLELIKDIRKTNILSEHHILIIHRETNTDQSLGKYLNIVETRIYGRSQIFFGKLS
tara:strand:+ start:2572 stop:3144 length:573 start_codon:yes stop_codon:yes gene_type:complete